MSNNSNRELLAIASIRNCMEHLAQLAIYYDANYLTQWKTPALLAIAGNESTAFVSLEEQNTELAARYCTVKCEMLIQFNEHDNFFLDGGYSSPNWNTLREEVIALPSSIGIHGSLLRMKSVE